MTRNGLVTELFKDYQEFCRVATKAMEPVGSLRERAVTLVAESKKRQRELQAEMRSAYGGQSSSPTPAFTKASLALEVEQSRAAGMGLILDRCALGVLHWVGDGRRMAELLSGD